MKNSFFVLIFLCICSSAKAIPECTFELGYYKTHSYLNYLGENYCSVTFQGALDPSQFGCDNQAGVFDLCYRGIFYRIQGTSDWDFIEDYISDDEGVFFYRITGLVPCMTYEFRVTCAFCMFPDFPCLYGFDYESEGLSDIFTIATAPPIAYYDPIENIQFDFLTETEFEVSWDPFPEAIDYVVVLTSTTQPSCVVVEIGSETNVTIDLDGYPSCESCREYNFEIRPRFTCASSTSWGERTNAVFQVGECAARIIEIVLDNTSAEIEFENLYGNPSQFLFTWGPIGGAAQSNIVSNSPFVIENLDPFSTYSVQLNPICPWSDCKIKNSEVFTTDCQTYEPNDTESEAQPILFNEEVVSYKENAGSDYYSFIPACEYITLAESSTISGAFSKDGESLANLGLADYPFSYWKVEVGEEYLMKVIYGENNACYQFTIIPYDFCEACPNEIIGPTSIELEGEPTYEMFNFYYGNIYTLDWSIEGPAEIVSSAWDYVNLVFSQPGTVTLTVVYTLCSGKAKTESIEIEVTGTSACQCGPIDDIYIDLPHTINDYFLCAADIHVDGVDCEESIYYWSFTHNYLYGDTYFETATTNESVYTLYYDGTTGVCENLEIEVYAKCFPGETAIYREVLNVCWHHDACRDDDDGGFGWMSGYYLSGTLVYPNPAQHEIVVSSSTMPFKKIKIFDLQGNLIEQREFASTMNQYQVTLDTYENGIYFLKIEDDQGYAQQEKFIVSKN